MEQHHTLVFQALVMPSDLKCLLLFSNAVVSDLAKCIIILTKCDVVHPLTLFSLHYAITRTMQGGGKKGEKENCILAMGIS